jgi:rhodanese-related sulfurtransferase
MRTWVMLALLNTLFSSFSAVQAQHAKTATCLNKAFDHKVNSYLSYSVPVISVSEAHQKSGDIVFLDAREKNEFDISHITNAHWVGYDDFQVSRVPKTSKDALVVVYCSIGYRSEKIAEKLIKAGYKRVRNLYGSLFEWVNAGYEVVDKQNKPVKKIHTYNESWSQWVLQPSFQKVY